MDSSQQTNSTRASLRKIRQDTRETRSLETLRQSFEQLQNLRRQSLDDFDLQVMIGDIHQEIVDRARYLRGGTATPAPTALHEDHSVIFQAKPSMEVKPPAAESAAAEALPAKPPSPAEPRQQPMALRSVHAPTPASLPDDEAAEIPPGVTRIDALSWKRIVWLALFLCMIALTGFFYLIQTMRKLNMPEENRAAAEQAAKPAGVAAAVPAVSLSPTLRLYTDLSPGTVTVDDGAQRSLVDGELMLDNLPAGQHSIKVSGSSGSASFQFEVAEKTAPKVIGMPQAVNALAVLVSQQDGHGQLVTSNGASQILVDGKEAGQTSAVAGLELVGLGSTDHDLQVVHDRDRQRFVMTYTAAPVLTVYVKSDSNTGILQVVTAEDGVEVYIDDTLFRRRTEHGQVRISIKAGRYPIRVHKDGFNDPPMQWVDVQKADVTQARFELTAAGAVAMLQIRGAQPGTTAYLDKEFVGAIGPDGSAKISNVKPGEHTIELRHELAGTKRLQRTFHPGETLTLAGADVALEKNTADTGKTGPPALGVAARSKRREQQAWRHERRGERRRPARRNAHPKRRRIYSLRYAQGGQGIIRFGHKGMWGEFSRRASCSGMQGIRTSKTIFCSAWTGSMPRYERCAMARALCGTESVVRWIRRVGCKWIWE